MGNYRTFSLSQMSIVQTCLKTLPWREKVCKANLMKITDDTDFTEFKNTQKNQNHP